MCLIDLLSILLKCIGFSRIQKAVVDQPGSRPQTVTMTFCWGQDWLWESALEILLSPATELVVAGCRIKSIFIAHHNPIKKWFVVVV